MSRIKDLYTSARTWLPLPYFDDVDVVTISVADWHRMAAEKDALKADIKSLHALLRTMTPANTVDALRKQSAELLRENERLRQILRQGL
jgi:hypothetical protein